jgi:hypothetical protein
LGLDEKLIRESELFLLMPRLPGGFQFNWAALDLRVSHIFLKAA